MADLRYLITKPLVILLYNLNFPIQNRGLLNVVAIALYAFCWIIYIGAFEALTRGKTLGKFITGTLAVNDDGTRISAATAFIRALSRLVPFEAFSALGGDPSYPWHDRWTGTVVIVESLSTLPLAE